MSRATQSWGWKWLNHGHQRHWPRFITRLLNDVGNYGVRGTVRERVVKGFGFWLRNNFVWKLGLHNVVPRLRVARGIPYKPSELRYSQRTRCRCGAGLAYYPAGFFLRSHPQESHGWTCADVLTGKVLANGIKDELMVHMEKTEPGDHVYLPFAFYEIRSEDQPSRNGERRKVLWGLLGERYATCREVGDSTRFAR